MTSGGWDRELKDLVRAISGGYIFGIPLLYTMEMWWLGERVTGSTLVTFVAVALLANFGLAWVAGFRHDGSIGGAAGEAVEAVAVGIVAASALLLVLNRMQPSDPPATLVGMVALQAVPLSIGASVANQVFGRQGERSRGGENGSGDMGPARELAADVGATAIGSVFIASSIGPTDEIPMIAAGLTYVHVVALVLFSLLVSYAIVFASEFDLPTPEGPFQHPVTETALAYAVSLGIAAGTLYLFQQFSPGEPPLSLVKQVLVLGLPATVGGAAGRLVI